MLKELIVNNLAIIENIDIKFNHGLTILLGETGAGKSLIIDSLGLLLGDRASTELIRNGETKATIKGIFSINNIHLTSFLNELGVSTIDNEITIERNISVNKSNIKINGVNINLNDLKNISKYLADIHMQFDSSKLLNPENNIEIIDGFKYDLTNEYKRKYLEKLTVYKDKYSEYEELIKKQKEINEKRDIYLYALEEIQKAELDIDEEDKINEEISLLKHYDKIYSLLGESDQIIREDFLDKLYAIKNNISKLSEYKKSYEDMNDKINNHYYELDDIFETIKKDFASLDYDPNRLDILETRLYQINNLKNKYKKDVKQLLEYEQYLKEALLSEEDFKILIEEKYKEVIDSYNSVYQAGKELSELRKAIAKSIKKELENNMEDLLLSAKFDVAIEEINKEADYKGDIFKLDGIDNITFLIETNIGEGLKPLDKIISGGESSRILLALTALFIKSQKISTVIFDEIDTGISGEVASRVAQKMYEISLSTQVIAITHNPQVAALGNNMIKISKSTSKGRTYTQVKELNLDEKIYEIASLISGNKITDTQLEYARELVLNK